MVGVVIILAIMFVIGPVAVFAGGALWSALVGWCYVASTNEHVGVDGDAAR